MEFSMYIEIYVVVPQFDIDAYPNGNHSNAMELEYLSISSMVLSNR